MRIAFNLLRILLLLALLTIALHVWLPAYSRIQWFVVLFATELGYLLPLAAGVLVLPSVFIRQWRRSIIGLALAVSVIGLTPLFQAVKQFPACVSIAKLVPQALPQPVGKFVDYRSVGNENLRFKFYAAQHNNAPVAVVLHGGGWRSRQLNQGQWLFKRLNQLGYSVVLPEYRLAPKHNFPAQTDDLLALFAYLNDHAQALNIDTNRIALIGRSAGGHLAMQLAFQYPDLAVQKVISLYGVTDLEQAWLNSSGVALLDGKKILSQFIGDNYPNVPNRYKDASPVNHLHRDIPETLIIHGERDDWVPVTQAKRLAALNHPNIKVNKLSWATHGMDILPYSPGGQVTGCLISQALKTQ